MGFVVLYLWVSLLCFVGFYGVRSTVSLGFSVVFCIVFMEFVVLNLWVSLLCFVGFYGVRSTLY
jgi:hypothetical protein